MNSTSSEFPIWYQAEAPIGSAVRYLASLSSKFEWVTIQVYEAKNWKPGPFLGSIAVPGSEMKVLVLGPQEQVLGQICIQSSQKGVFGVQEQAWANRISKELAQIWPKKSKPHARLRKK